MRAGNRQLALTLGLALAASPAYAATEGSPVDLITTPVEFLRSWLKPDTTVGAQDHLVTLSSSQATIAFQARERPTLRFSFIDGRVLIDGDETGTYVVGGPLDREWHRLLMDAAQRSTPEAVVLLQQWQPAGLTDAEQAIAKAISTQAGHIGAIAVAIRPQVIAPAGPDGPTIDLTDLSHPDRLEPALSRAANLSGPSLKLTVPGGQARLGDYTVGSSETVSGPLLVLKGDANIYGRLNGNLVAVDGNVVLHPGGLVTGDVLALGGEVHQKGGTVMGDVRTISHAVASAGIARATPPLSGGQLLLRSVLGLAGIALCLWFLGFGFVTFGRENLSVISDTISHSFLRSFATGLLGQVLLVPTFAIVIAGLVLSLVGILLIPFAAVVFALLALVTVLGGLLAVAHAVGETYTRRRLASGAIMAGANSYRYMLGGLGITLSVWVVWALFAWTGAIGSVILAVAALSTWFLGTAGFGAMLLSRGGFRGQFAGRFIPPEALTDEYLWATPQFGVPAVKRPASGPGAKPPQKPQPQPKP